MLQAFEGFSGKRAERTPYPTWEFVPTTESKVAGPDHAPGYLSQLRTDPPPPGKPGPYYMRKAEGLDQRARVVSAVWTISSTVKDVTELGLTWPNGDNRRGDGERRHLSLSR